MKVLLILFVLCITNITLAFAGKATLAALLIGAAALKGGLGKFIPIPLILPLPIP